MRDARSRVERYGAPADGKRLIQAPELPLSVAQVAEYLRIIRFDSERTLVTGGGVILLTQF